MKIVISPLRRNCALAANMLLLIAVSKVVAAQGEPVPSQSDSRIGFTLESDPGLLLVQLGQAEKCAQNLRRLVLSLQVDAMDHGNRYASNLLDLRLLANFPGTLSCPAETNCPATEQGRPTDRLPPTYVLKLPAKGSNPSGTNALLVCPLHQAEALEDGSVACVAIPPANVDRAGWSRMMDAFAKMTPVQQEEVRKLLQARSQRVICDTNLKQLLAALRAYGMDHDGVIPTNLNALASSVSPLVCTCPADADKSSVWSWDAYRPDRNLSYRLLPVPQPRPGEATNIPLLVCPVHGRAIFTDGQVRPHGSPRPGSGQIL